MVGVGNPPLVTPGRAVRARFVSGAGVQAAEQEPRRDEEAGRIGAQATFLFSSPSSAASSRSSRAAILQPGSKSDRPTCSSGALAEVGDRGSWRRELEVDICAVATNGADAGQRSGRMRGRRDARWPPAKPPLIGRGSHTRAAVFRRLRPMKGADTGGSRALRCRDHYLIRRRPPVTHERPAWPGVGGGALTARRVVVVMPHGRPRGLGRGRHDGRGQCRSLADAVGHLLSSSHSLAATSFFGNHGRRSSTGVIRSCLSP